MVFWNTRVLYRTRLRSEIDREKWPKWRQNWVKNAIKTLSKFWPLFIVKKCTKRAPKGLQKRSKRTPKGDHFWCKSSKGVPRGSGGAPKRFLREIIDVFCRDPLKTWVWRGSAPPRDPKRPHFDSQSAPVWYHFRTAKLLCLLPNRIIHIISSVQHEVS